MDVCTPSTVSAKNDASMLATVYNGMNRSSGGVVYITSSASTFTRRGGSCYSCPPSYGFARHGAPHAPLLSRMIA